MTQPTPGISLCKKVLAGPNHENAHKGKEYIFSEVNGYCLVRNDRYKLGINLTSVSALANKTNLNGVPVEMYDLQNDPNEYKNVVNAPEYRAVQEQLAQVLNQHVNENLNRERLIEVLNTPTDDKFGLS